MPPRTVINGRFGHQRTTGVQRVAHALLAALDAMPSLPGHWQLLAPPGAAWPALARIGLVEAGGALGRGHLWEQAVAARAAAGGALLLNIAGSGPWAGPAQVSWLHDAAVFDHPGAYRPAFVAWYRALFRRRVRRGDVLVAPSRFAQQRLALHLGVEPGRIHVLPHGADHLDAVAADPGALARLGLGGAGAPEAPGYWLAIASANPTKNIARLLEAHAALPAPGRARLVLVGGDNPRVFAADAGGRAPAALGAGVQPVGAVDDATLKALLAGARALVLPSLVEGFGLPAVEALRLGTPVVAARAGALPEVCGDAAEFVDPLDVADIARGLAATLDEPRRRQLAERGRARAATMRWHDAAAALVALLRSRGLLP